MTTETLGFIGAVVCTTLMVICIIVSVAFGVMIFLNPPDLAAYGRRHDNP